MKLAYWNLTGLVCLAFMIGLTFYAAISLGFASDDELEFESVFSISMDVIGMAICVVLFATTLFDHRMNMATVYFMALIALESLLLFWEMESWLLDGNPDKITYIKIVNYYTFGFVQIMMVTFWLYQKEIVNKTDRYFKYFGWSIYSLFAIGMILIVTNSFTGLLFNIDEETGVYQRGDGYLLATITPLIMVIISGIATRRYINTRHNRLAPYSYTVMPTVAAIIQFFINGLGVFCISLLFAIIIIYGNFYVARGKELAFKQSQYMETKVAMRVSQIRPKLLFKSLSSIQHMEGNPPETQRAIADFSKYMRENLDTLGHTETIPFDKEMGHVETYVELEKLRFKDKLTTTYDIKDRDFRIPALTLQIIVENAIKHGVTQKENGGTVKISSYETDDSHIVSVEDDGVGFDTTLPPKDQSKSHVGLVNIKERVEEMTGGSIVIESEIGKGTKAIVIIPKLSKNTF